MPSTDHFSPVATHYAMHRPDYPAALFSWLADQCVCHQRAWDCGTGNGQAAIQLASFFECVEATDVSAAQLAQASTHSRVHYREAAAERSGLADHSVDLLVVAQALHWFKFDDFYTEVFRVLKPRALIAVWSYGVLHIDDKNVNDIFKSFYRDDVGSYWPPERRHVENAYREIPFPFDEIQVPVFAMQRHWSLSQLLGYCRSWSASASFERAMGVDPVNMLEQRLSPFWDTNTLRSIEWPLAIRVGRYYPR